MPESKNTLLVDSLVSLGLFTRSNSILYVHSLPEKLTKRMEHKLGGLDVANVRSLKEKRDDCCTSKQ